MATAYAPPAVYPAGGIGSANASASHQPSIKDSLSSSSNTSGFKVYGSLFKVDARYQFLHPLGKGSYGIVCAAKDRETGMNLAIKKVAPMAKRTADARHTLREVLLLQLLGRHPNIISIHNLSTNLKEDELYIVMDLMDTDMHRVIQSSQALSESHVKYFLHQLLRGVKYLHDNGVLHRDLKPGNLLLSKTCQLKIADFGLARKFPKPRGTSSSSTGSTATAPSGPATAPPATRIAIEKAPMTEHVVTRWYRAPELMLQPDGLYDQSVDMWSVGCIFAEILGRKALFPGKNFLHQLSLIFDVIGTPPSESTACIKSAQAQRFLKSLGKKPKVPLRSLFPAATDDALDLLDKLLEFDPSRRISAQGALAHPYMQAIEKKYKGSDPHPSSRIDFSFDSNKKLTKMDLQSLILKEVETFRKSTAHAAALDNEQTEEEFRERDTRPSSAPSTVHSAGSKHQPCHVTSSAKSIISGTGSSSNPAAAQAKVMCGPAGISMINSMLRQQSAAPKNQPTEAHHPNHRTEISSTTSAAIAIGSNRPRIRLTTKPPVPRQQGPESAAPISNQNQYQHEHHHHQYHQQERAAPHNHNEDQHAPVPMAVHRFVTERLASSRPASAAAAIPETLTTTMTTTTEDTLPQTRAFHFQYDDPGRQTEETAIESHLGSHTTQCITAASAGPTTVANGPCDPTKAIAAAIALGERSKALISALSQQTKSTLALQKTQPTSAHIDDWRTAVAPTDSDRAAVVRDGGTNNRSSNARLTRKTKQPECSSSPSSSGSSSSSSSSDSDIESRQLYTSLAHKSTKNAAATSSQQDARATRSSLPRRASSAGPTRVRTSLLTPSSNNNNNNMPADASHNSTTAAFVGSTNSLIRAQRAGTGQTLTESANSMLATMDNSSSHPQTQPRPREFERDESVVFAPPVQSSSGMKTQRSISQLQPPPTLNQQQQHQQQDPVASKKPPKRLTVPKSPKFSVMSWQKKRADVPVIRPRSATAMSHSTAVTTTSIPATARK